MANELNSNQIAQILPHRFPFALVDRITDYEPGQWAKGRKSSASMSSSSAATSPRSTSCPVC